MRALKLIVFLTVLALAAPAFAQPVQAPGDVTPKGGCYDYPASGKTALFYTCPAGFPCSNTFGTYPVVHNSGGSAHVTIQEDFARSGAGTYQCHIRWSSSGYSATEYSTLRDYSDGSVLYLTDTSPDLIFTGNLPYWWVFCDAATSWTAFRARTCPVNSK